MISKLKHLLTALAISGFVISTPMTASAAEPSAATIEEGKKLAFSRSKGNCLACHAIKEGTMPGNIGPALIAMKLRYPDKQKLFDKIWGTQETTIPNSMMPPFGKHSILTDGEISAITDYIYTL